MTSLLTKLFQFVIITSKKYNIDESHGLSHSMNVLNFAHNIYNSQLPKSPEIRSQDKIIYVSAILHDMCDKKYLDEETGINEITGFLKETDKLSNKEIAVTKKIIQTMSYSTIKKYGFPELKNYQTAYHIVREADLLTAYDFDRCLIYDMYKKDGDIQKAFEHATNLFETRVFTHEDDGLLITDYSKTQHNILKFTAQQRINSWRSLLNNKKLL